MKKHLIIFEGRIGRVEFFLSFLAVMALFWLSDFIVTIAEGGSLFGEVGLMAAYLLMLLVAIYSVFFQIGISIRRFHDFNKSGWWYLSMLVPFVNLIVLLVLLFRQGTGGPNKYGSQS